MNSLNSLLQPKDQWLQLAVEKKWVSQAELMAVVAKAHSERKEASLVLREAKELTEEQIAELKAESAGAAFVDVADYDVDAAALRLVPETLARKHQVLPLYRIGSALTIAMRDPWDAVAIDAMRAATKLPIINPVVALPSAIQKAIERHYGLKAVEEAAQPTEGFSDGQALELAEKSPAEAASDVSIAKLVDALLSEALEARASDIHIEPDSAHTRIRFRIDGVLHEIKLLPIGLHEALCSRIKILAKLDISEHRLPQDGHIPLAIDNHNVDMRISVYPTVAGENVVVRLLDQSAVALQLGDLGMEADHLEHFERILHHSHGLLLVTGPTGSGKTTTLYAGLSKISDMTKNIVTIEDPVEYRIPLIRQTQVNPKAGLTFAAGLRALLRQDPDIMMVGEIRDRDTVDIAMDAALTGHLVLSTLHTNSAAGAIARMLDIGAEPFLVASTLLGVVAQRLVRRICPECQQASRPPQEIRERFPELSVVYRGRGCRHCRKTGFCGRIGIFEIMVVDEAIREKIAERSSTAILQALSIEHGMRIMRSDGMRKVQSGLTTLDELERVVPPDEA